MVLPWRCYQHPRAWTHLSLERRCIMDSLSPRDQDGNSPKKKRVVSPEGRAKMSAAKLGKPRGPHSEATKQKIREGNIGKKVSEDTKAKLSQMNKGKSPTNKGVPMTEEQKRRLSEAKKGQKHSEETRRKLSLANKGRSAPNKGIPHTEEHKRKISEGLRRNNPMRGKHHTQETKDKISQASKGKCYAPFDEEHKKKISKAHQGMKQSEEHRASVQAYWDAMTPEERAEKTKYMLLAQPKSHSTSIEIAVWNELESREINFEKQKRIGRYLVDIYLPERNLVLECDGCWWHGCLECGYDYDLHKAFREKDKKRTMYIESKGYQVIHLWQHDILANVEEIVTNALKVSS